MKSSNGGEKDCFCAFFSFVFLDAISNSSIIIWSSLNILTFKQNVGLNNSRFLMIGGKGKRAEGQATVVLKFKDCPHCPFTNFKLLHPPVAIIEWRNGRLM